MDIAKKIIRKKNFYDLHKLFYNQPITEGSKQLSVLILNAPCNGFGDIVFAMKFANLLQEWYNCKVTILTTQKDSFVSLGAQPESIVELQSASPGNLQCRRFKFLNISKQPKKADLIFVAPLQADYIPVMDDVKSLIPYANKFNTFFVSEYNDSMRTKTDFHTGVGSKRYGLLFTEPNIGPRPDIKNPYCVVYVAKDLSRMKNCVYNFVNMVGKKYSKRDFEVVIPSWVEEVEMVDPLCNILSKYYGAIVIKRKGKEDTIIELDNNKKYNAYLRLDIFPLPNAKMIDLMHYSVKDILLTGDQSITDALSCCVDKNIFYQIAPWKKNFASNLVKELPNKWLQKSSESCGGLKAIRYKSNYKAFKKNWDFRILAKPEMDSIFAYTIAKKSGKLSSRIKEYEQMVMKKGRKSAELKEKIGEIGMEIEK
jgi:hypothetical protein